MASRFGFISIAVLLSIALQSVRSQEAKAKHALPFYPQAVAIWKDKLFFLVDGSPDIRVYNAEPFAFNRTITVSGMKKPCDIVTGENVLYVSEWDDKLIHRIELPEESVSNWTVIDGIRLTLSIAKNGNVIVAGRHPNKIFEYTSFGNLVREIVVNKYDADLIGLTHAIQFEDNKFLVCHAWDLHRVCMIDDTGRVIKCYGENRGSWIGQLNRPFYLAMDRNGFILVADCYNNRIVRLNSSLEYISETVGVQYPTRILLSEERGRMYVIEAAAGDESLTVFDI